jgi:hypothetical protein
MYILFSPDLSFLKNKDIYQLSDLIPQYLWFWLKDRKYRLSCDRKESIERFDFFESPGIIKLNYYKMKSMIALIIFCSISAFGISGSS